MATFQHSETGARIEVPDEPGVAELYEGQGWVPADAEDTEHDPAFGTYDGDDYADKDDKTSKSKPSKAKTDKS